MKHATACIALAAACSGACAQGTILEFEFHLRTDTGAAGPGEAYGCRVTFDTSAPGTPIGSGVTVYPTLSADVYSFLAVSSHTPRDIGLNDEAFDVHGIPTFTAEIAHFSNGPGDEQLYFLLHTQPFVDTFSFTSAAIIANPVGIAGAPATLPDDPASYQFGPPGPSSALVVGNTEAGSTVTWTNASAPDTGHLVTYTVREVSGAEPCTADCDGNGSLNVDDIDCFVNSFLGGCP